MLRVPIRVQIEMVPQFIVSCCVLHNVGKFLNDDWEDDETDEKDVDEDDVDDVPDGNVPLNPPVRANSIRTAGHFCPRFIAIFAIFSHRFYRHFPHDGENGETNSPDSSFSPLFFLFWPFAIFSRPMPFCAKRKKALKVLEIDGF